jgi:hypothetical protein
LRHEWQVEADLADAVRAQRKAEEDALSAEAEAMSAEAALQRLQEDAEKAEVAALAARAKVCLVLLSAEAPGFGQGARQKAACACPSALTESGGSLA